MIRSIFTTDSFTFATVSKSFAPAFTFSGFPASTYPPWVAWTGAAFLKSKFSSFRELRCGPSWLCWLFKCFVQSDFTIAHSPTFPISLDNKKNTLFLSLKDLISSLTLWFMRVMTIFLLYLRWSLMSLLNYVFFMIYSCYFCFYCMYLSIEL